MEDMADAGELECIVVELDGESSSGPSDLDSTDFSDIEELNATFNLGFHQPELADRQEPNTPPIKSRPARQGKPTAKVIQRRQKKTPKNPRARSSKEKNPLPKTSVRAKAFANILPSKPRQPRAAARASGKKKNVEEEDELDDIRPETDLGLGIGLRDRSKLKAPVLFEDQTVATTDLMQRPGSKTVLKIGISTEKSGKTHATRSSATPSNIRGLSQNKDTPSAPRTPRKSKKPPPKTTEYAEPKLSPHDSGFSEISSTDDDQALSDFAPPSSSSSDSLQESSVISSSSPEEDVEEDIAEPSSPEVIPQRERKPYLYFAANITVKDADARSDPPVGPELLELAQDAWSKGYIAKRWNPEVARFVNGIWMAPDKCDSCRANKFIGCDRAYPCCMCVKKGNHCNIRTVMTRTACRDSPRNDDVMTPLHLNAPIVSQNGDETWNSMKQEPPTIRPKKRKWGDAGKDTAKSKGRGVVSTTRDHMLNNKTDCSGETSQHLRAPYTLQYSDGSWNLIEQARSVSGLDKRKRKYSGESQAPGRSAAKKQHKLPESGYSSGEETDLGNPVDPEQALVRSKRVPKAPRTYVLYHQSGQENLPAPYGQPPVWASKRQQLCEALPYYRAYMSGGYLHDGLTRAVLIDKEIRERDIFGEEVVITRCGGGRKMDEVTHRMVQTAHQETSAYGLGLERARDLRSPIVIIAGQGNPKSPAKLPHYYNVLDWFHVTDVWVEMVEGFKTWCVRMEKIDLNKKSWWARVGSPLPHPERDLNAIKAASKKCIHCTNTSKAIFEQGWTCLKSSCDKFFVFDSPLDDRELTYSEAYLQERTAYSGNAPGPLAPPLMTEADMIIAGNRGVKAAFKQGIVCPLCKGCSRRIQWSKWSCETVGCDFTHSLPFRITNVKDTMSDIPGHLTQQNYARGFGIKYEAKRIGGYNVFEYGMPGPDGEVVGVLQLFKSTEAINHQHDGPNDLFRLMQERDFDLRRRPVRQHNSNGEILTNHFATNWGAPYKFVVTQSSRGFSEAPVVIIKALKRLTWAGEQALKDIGEPFHPFNELLSIGYFEDCSIGFHDDGESTLGPTVATLSLGASATMALRPKAKAAIGVASRNAKGTKNPVLRVTLDHGDMVIMHGSGVQKYYEHEVVPSGTLRFALTCRYVRPDTLENDADREDARIKGTLPEGHEQYTYYGDEDAIFTQDEMKKAGKAERINAMMRMFNDEAVIFKASSSEGDVDELCQMRNLMGDQMKTLMGRFENGALAPSVVGESMCRKDYGEEVDVTIPSAP